MNFSISNFLILFLITLTETKVFRFIKMNNCETRNAFVFMKICTVDEVSLNILADLKIPVTKLLVSFKS